MSQSPASKKDYYKLAALVSLIGLLAGLGFWQTNSSGLLQLLGWLMAVWLLVFGGFKLIGYRQFVTAFRGYDIIAKGWRPWAWLFPWLEISLGIAYLFEIAPTARDWLVVVIFGLASLGVARAIYANQPQHYQCACLGRLIRLPLSKLSLVENLTMLVMVAVMLVYA